MNKQKKRTSKQGFTLVEMIIVVPMVILIIGTFITAIINLTGSVIAERSADVMTFNIQDALNRIEQDVKLSGGYLATNNITITSPQGYNNDTTGFDNNANVPNTTGDTLILNAYATTSNPLTSDRNLIYVATPANPCISTNPLINQNPPLMMNVIYFVKGSTLWRRTILPNSTILAKGCDAETKLLTATPWQQSSCAPNITGTLCKTQDIKLVDGVNQTNGFLITYYINQTISATADSPSVTDDSTRQTELNKITSIKVSITANQNIAGHNVTESGIIRTTSPNNNTLAN